MIDYESHLNPAQWEAVRTVDGPVLVLAGAGSGKTRTIVYRLAYMTQQGVPPQRILLLTFTRKAAQEMLHRAGQLLGHGAGALHGVQGGTFHAFAYSVLRRTPPPGFPDRCTLMDRSDAEAVLRELKADAGLGKGDRSFPKVGTILDHYSKARNKELSLEEVIKQESFHLISYTGAMQEICTAYAAFRREKGLLDYDDLLFGLEALFRETPEALARCRERFSHVMVDEYQDTNLVQDRLVMLLAGQGGNVMAVGDDAQSIYAFRGANVSNILTFPDRHPGARLVKLEQNYRSTQPILDLTNAILSQAAAQFRKHLFSDRHEGPTPRLVRPLSDRTQAQLVCEEILRQSREYGPGEVAVLFRAGYHSYHLEVALNRAGVRFKKYGGLKYTEAAHIKDALAYLRVVVNPADMPAMQRILAQAEGVGPKTATNLFNALMAGDAKASAKIAGKHPLVKEMLELLDRLRTAPPAPAPLLEQILEFYQPILERLHPDDHPRRRTGLEELAQIAAGYEDAGQFLADLHLENPDQAEAEGEPAVCLSTIHSAKGLEWKAVHIIDLVEDRFPSRQAMVKAEDFEEERRLLYVACTRARDELCLYVPTSIYKRGQSISEPAVASPFLREMGVEVFEEWREGYNGALSKWGGIAREQSSSYAGSSPAPRQGSAAIPSAAPPVLKSAQPKPADLGWCTHKVFGRGKLVQHLPPDKYRVNFPNFGLKVILAEYLEREE
ncbi:ATP-dependent helicase [Megalodesulfovibrio paquesii]